MVTGLVDDIVGLDDAPAVAAGAPWKAAERAGTAKKPGKMSEGRPDFGENSHLCKSYYST